MIVASVGIVLLGIFVGIPVLAFFIYLGVQSGGFTKKEREITRTRELKRIREQGERKK